MIDIDATNYTGWNQILVILYNEAEVNGRLIYKTRRKLFYNICHICIKKSISTNIIDKRELV